MTLISLCLNHYTKNNPLFRSKETLKRKKKKKKKVVLLLPLLRWFCWRSNVDFHAIRASDDYAFNDAAWLEQRSFLYTDTGPAINSLNFSSGFSSNSSSVLKNAIDAVLSKLLPGTHDVFVNIKIYVCFCTKTAINCAEFRDGTGCWEHMIIWLYFAKRMLPLIFFSPSDKLQQNPHLRRWSIWSAKFRLMRYSSSIRHFSSSDSIPLLAVIQLYSHNR